MEDKMVTMEEVLAMKNHTPAKKTKKSEGYKALEAKIVELEEKLQQAKEIEKHKIEQEGMKFEYHLRQCMKVFSILETQGELAQFLRDECGRLNVNCIKLIG